MSARVDVIQLKRRKGWRKPAGVVTVARTSGGPSGIGFWGNPFPPLADGDHDGRDEAAEAFRSWLQTGEMPEPWESVFATEDYRQSILRRLPELRGKDLACWCPQPGPCHGRVLAELATEATP